MILPVAISILVVTFVGLCWMAGDGPLWRDILHVLSAVALAATALAVAAAVLLAFGAVLAAISNGGAS